jgi:TolB-like protein
MLTAPQIARMSRLLDEALELDPEGRRRWLEVLSPEYQDLRSALRRALLPESAAAADSNDLAALPKIGAAGGDIESVSSLQVGQLVGPYRLISPLGAGGMAEVWLAQRADGAFKREVALKLPVLLRLRRDLASRFARERDILAGLEHQNIARLYDAGVSADGLPYFAMEHVVGQPLTDWCDAHQLGIRERLKLFLQVLDAVQYAHGHQVIHRDIKPSNILVTDSGQVRLLDFGVAKLLAQEDEQTDLTQLYGRALTPEYASPELVRGDAIGAPTDVYSLGVVLCELLSGNRPYRLEAGASATLLEHAIASVHVERPSTQVGPEAGGERRTTRQKLARRLKGDLDAIVLKALAKAPADRYCSVAALADDLQRYLSGEPIEARPDHLIYRFSKLALRHRTELGTTVAATVLVATALGYALLRSPGAERVLTANTARAGQGTAAATADDKSIAVLPFVDMSEKRDQEYFSDGLSEELIDRLARSTDLKVIARTSSFQFKGKNEDVRRIAGKLGVANLLEGSVRKAGHEMRITAQLIRASDGSHLWSQSYDRDLVDIFKVQDEIAGTVAQALHAAFASGDRASNRETDVEAYNLVLEGNYFKARRTLPDDERAVQLYRKAIEIKPDYALAWARLASAYLSQETLKGTPSAVDNKRILDALERAIRLDPTLVWAYYTRAGFQLNVAWDWAAARADHERMREIEPRNNYLLPSALGDIALTFGQIDRAIELYRKVVDGDPLDSYSLDDLGNALCAASRLQECLQSRLKLLQLHPEFGGVNSAVGMARLHLGQFDEALEAMQSEPAENHRLAGLVMAYWAIGRRAESDAALKSLTEKFASSDAYEIAEVHAYRKQIDAAHKWLDRAYWQHDVGMLGIKSDPLLRNLHTDRRFRALLIKMKLAD